MSNEELEFIRQAIKEGNYQYTYHALVRATERHISRSEVEQALANAEIIENYPQDKYGPSCLLYGEVGGRVLHLQVSCPPSAIKIITVYEPNPDEWDEYRVRKQR